MLFESLCRWLTVSVVLQEHKQKYIFLLAYASSVCDNWNFKKGTRKSINKDELKGTTQVCFLEIELSKLLF